MLRNDKSIGTAAMLLAAAAMYQPLTSLGKTPSFLRRSIPVLPKVKTRFDEERIAAAEARRHRRGVRKLTNMMKSKHWAK